MASSRWRPGERAARGAVAAGAAALLATAAVLLASAPAGAAPARSGRAGGHGGPVSVTMSGGHALPAASHGRPAAARPLRPFGDWPPGFWFGTDSWPISMNRTVPYQEPVLGGDYGGYIGMIGNWAYRLGCHGRIAWSPVNSADANYNYTTYNMGIGTGVYWFMGGPGVDPRYNGTTTEAYDWGAQQAAYTLSDVSAVNVTYPVIFEDVELPGIAPAPDNGWNDVYSSPCSGRVVSTYIPAVVDRAEFDGFAAYVTSHSSYHVGVYSAPSAWTAIFGTGSESLIPNTYEWTYTADTSSLSHQPDGWCLRGTSTCAQFFGGQTSSSPYALMWQWSGGGGTYNGYGDFDQIDKTRMP